MDARESTRADYAGLGVSPGQHLVAFYHDRLRRKRVLSAAELQHIQGGLVRVGGIVICRQRPETAREFMFMTIEGETGLVNVVVQPAVYGRIAQILRGEPLLIVEGILQREDGVINSMARRACSLTVLDAGTKQAMAPAAPAIASHDFR